MQSFLIGKLIIILGCFFKLKIAIKLYCIINIPCIDLVTIIKIYPFTNRGFFGMYNKIKVAIVGLGRISKKHIESLQNLENQVEIVALCDSDINALNEVKKDFRDQVKYFTSIEELCSAEKYDLVSICTPSGMHSEHGIIAARSGSNVLVEKPIGTKSSDADMLVQECANNNVKLFVVKQNRFNPPLIKLKNAVESGEMGKIYSIHSNVFWTRPQEYYDQAEWRGTYALDGGAFMNQASHYVDLMYWLGGDVYSLFAYTDHLARNIEAEDSGVVSLKYKNGAFGSMNVTMLTYPKNYEGSITVIAEKGTVKIGGIALNKLEHWFLKDDQTCTDVSYETSSVYGFGHTEYYKEVIKDLRGEKNNSVDGNEGLKSLKVIEAIYDSSRLKREIILESK